MIKVCNCTEKEFKEIIKAREVICFGAGRELYKICQQYVLLPYRLKVIVDNKKYGTNVTIGDVKIPVISMDQVNEEMLNYFPIISTNRYADEFIKQLDRVELYNEKKFYIPYFFTNDKKIVSFRQGKEQRIPKKIHYCWFGNSEIPKQFCDNIETWKKYCPDYEIVLWNEDNYDVSKNKYMRQAYEAQKWGFVPDYARLDIVNTYGGIYLDTDVELLRPIDELLQYEMFCGFENDKYVAFGLGFGAVKNHEILQKMMDEYDRTEFIKGNGELNLIASPIYQTKVLENYGLIRNGNSQVHEKFTVFSSEYFAPINAYGIGQPTLNSYSIHQYAATWFDDNLKAEKEQLCKSIRYVMQRLGEVSCDPI